MGIAGIACLTMGLIITGTSCCMPLVTRKDGAEAKRVLDLGGTFLAIGFVLMLATVFVQGLR